MTLDLGFAHLLFDDGVEAGIVDVPGHERFLHNMLAGAAGMELLLLVVDADEGVMPQTLEHLAILRFLNVSGVIVVAQQDRSRSETRNARRPLARIEAQLRRHDRRRRAAVAVSAVTGENVPRLRELLHGALRELPPRNDRRRRSTCRSTASSR